MSTMNWGLQQGLMGAKQQTLSPSLNSIGPNRYLTREDFIKMVGLALLLHAAIVGVASLLPDEHVTDIPVRALSFKIGDADHHAVTAPRYAYTPPVVAPQPAPAPAPAPKATPTPASNAWRAHNPVTPPKIAAPQPEPIVPLVRPADRQAPVDNPKPLAPLPQVEPAPQPSTPPVTETPAPLAALPDPALLSQPAVAPNPQRFVRENDTAGAATSAAAAANNLAPAAGASATEDSSAQAVRARYEQVIAGWVQKHQLYPSAAHGAKGRVVMRFQIDRSGNVRYYGVDESSGNTVLDNAAVDMIRRANPMPAVPLDYPAGNLIEFIIPINFSPPR